MRTLLFLIITSTSAFTYGKEKPFNLNTSQNSEISIQRDYRELVDLLIAFAVENKLSVVKTDWDTGELKLSNIADGIDPYLDCGVFIPDGYIARKSAFRLDLNIFIDEEKDPPFYILKMNGWGLVTLDPTTPVKKDKSGKEHDAVVCHSSFLIESLLAEYLQEYDNSLIKKDVK